MKNASKRQYILTLIVSFVAIVVLSLCTIMTFYKKSVNDTLALAAETVKQEQEYMNSYLNRAVDAVEVTKITVEHMMREGRPEQDILNFLTNESDYYLQDIDAAFTGVYGFINGEYLDGIGWFPTMIMFLRSGHGTRQQWRQTASQPWASRTSMRRQVIF